MKGGRGNGYLTEVVHNRQVKRMKKNLTRKTRHDDNSLTPLHHIQREMEKNKREIHTLANEIQRSRDSHTSERNSTAKGSPEGDGQ